MFSSFVIQMSYECCNRFDFGSAYLVSLSYTSRVLLCDRECDVTMFEESIVASGVKYDG
jgi:hypothetical protein